MVLTMTERDEVDELIADLKRMARQVGAEFIPDPKKVKEFRERHPHGEEPTR